MIEDLKERAIHRSRILQGQMKGLEKMINDEDYCLDILVQSLAIQRSLRSLNKLVLENHLRTHAAEQIGSTDKKKQAESIKELLGLYELSNVRGK